MVRSEQMRHGGQVVPVVQIFVVHRQLEQRPLVADCLEVFEEVE